VEELLELRKHVEQGEYVKALTLIGEMEEMSREDKVNKIYSFVRILLIHLIKQHAEKRTTRSWDLSIRNAIEQVGRVNKRRKAGGTYLSQKELQETIHEAYPSALSYSAVEAFGGAYEEAVLAKKVNRSEIEQTALERIMSDFRWV
jgi:hypothetical protein